MAVLESFRSQSVFATPIGSINQHDRRYQGKDGINHSDIVVTGSSRVKVYQFIDKSIQEESINIQQDKYQSYEITDLQFKIEDPQTNLNLSVSIPFNNRLSSLHAKYSIMCKYNADLNAWEKININIDEVDQAFRFNVKESGIYAVFTNLYWYSTFTQNLANEYPQWTRIRKSRDSIGQQFLNFFGMHFEEVEGWLNWIDEQKHLATADIHVLDWVYIYPIPKVKESDTLQFFYQEKGKTLPLHTISNIRDFFNNASNSGGIVDYEERRFYTTKSYEEVRGIIRNENGLSEFKATPVPFHLWNAFDEFGLLLDKKRLHLETNRDFKERLLDVFRYPANSSNQGLTHGIAQELNLINRLKEVTWENDSKSFLIHNKTGWPIDVSSLRIDDQPISDEEFDIINDQHITIHPRHQFKKHTISFIYGIEKHELHNQQDMELKKMIYHSNGQATSKLINWVAYINTVAPIMWNHFKWDEGFWDTVSKDLTGIGFIPNMWDTDIDKWKDYVFDVDRWEDEQIWKK